MKPSHAINRKCINNPNLFCFICGLFTPKSISRRISQSLKNAYHKRFLIPLQDQEKHWAPHVACDRCYQALMKNKQLPFSYPMVWFEPVGHHDCYFCVTKIFGYALRTRELIQYADVNSAVKPISKEIKTDVDITSEIISISSTSSNEIDSDEYLPIQTTTNKISQSQLDTLVKEFNFSKSDSQKLGSMLYSFNVLESNTRYSHYRFRDRQYSIYFNVEDDIVFCHNTQGLLNELCFDSNINNWWIFIDSSTSSLKVVLLHKLSKFPSIPLAYARHKVENYDTVSKTLELIKYRDLQLNVCGDLKIIGILMGLQQGYVKNMCFLCLWDTRNKCNQYVLNDWPLRDDRIIGKHNVIKPALIEANKILLPPLHIKLGLFKQFVKSLQSQEAKDFLVGLFPRLSEAKLKEGVFIGPQLRKLMKNSEDFQVLLNENEDRAWKALVAVTKGFIGKHRDKNYRILIDDMMEAFDLQKVRMSLKVHFLKSHLDFFHNDFGNINDEHGERFHQTIMMIEKRYCGRADERMMGDFCWLLKTKD